MQTDVKVTTGPSSILRAKDWPVCPVLTGPCLYSIELTDLEISQRACSLF